MQKFRMQESRMQEFIVNPRWRAIVSRADSLRDCVALKHLKHLKHLT